ncbi:unnamed protein product [Peronospora effusa]|nr:unnamed protein product [Peronospora effusa]
MSRKKGKKRGKGRMSSDDEEDSKLEVGNLSDEDNLLSDGAVSEEENVYDDVSLSSSVDDGLGPMTSTDEDEDDCMVDDRYDMMSLISSSTSHCKNI